jgi:hypothetical protein
LAAAEEPDELLPDARALPGVAQVRLPVQAAAVLRRVPPPPGYR